MVLWWIAFRKKSPLQWKCPCTKIWKIVSESVNKIIDESSWAWGENHLIDWVEHEDEKDDHDESSLMTKSSNVIVKCLGNFEKKVCIINRSVEKGVTCISTQGIFGPIKFFTVKLKHSHTYIYFISGRKFLKPEFRARRKSTYVRISFFHSSVNKSFVQTIEILSIYVWITASTTFNQLFPKLFK